MYSCVHTKAWVVVFAWNEREIMESTLVMDDKAQVVAIRSVLRAHLDPRFWPHEVGPPESGHAVCRSFTTCQSVSCLQEETDGGFTISKGPLYVGTHQMPSTSIATEPLTEKTETSLAITPRLKTHARQTPEISKAGTVQ